jgi:hypothetical protein
VIVLRERLPVLRDDIVRPILPSIWRGRGMIAWCYAGGMANPIIGERWRGLRLLSFVEHVFFLSSAIKNPPREAGRVEVGRLNLGARHPVPTSSG